jgi:ribosomal protein L16 Arg81 hydroxylase
MHDVMETKQTATMERPVKPAGIQFSEILDPITPEELLEKYWGRHSLYIPGGSKDLSRLVNRKTFVRFAAEADCLEAWIANDERTKNRAIMRIAQRQINPLYDAGFTICAKGLEKGSTVLTELTKHAKAVLHYTGNVDFRGYLSGHGSGATTHFDARHATTLQIEGEKVWRYAVEPSVPFPPRNAALDDGVASYIKVDPVPRVRALGLDPPLGLPSQDLEFKEVTLRPGDVLYLPPGTWHSAQAVGHSLAVNMAFNYGSVGTTLELAADLLYALMYNDPKWRMTPPPFAQEVVDGAMPGRVQQFLSERLDELRTALAGVKPDDPRLAAVWRTRVLGK